VRQFIRIQGLKGIRVLCLVLWFPSMLWANEAYQMKPIDYDNSEAVDVISAYFKEASHLKTWEGPGRTDYLYSFLEAFDIPVESQVLVFSKTSLQASRISPRTPRAIYFNDEIYVAWVPNGNRLEVSVPSPRTGTNFYTIRDDQGRPELIRETHSCLRCHGDSFTRHVPGHFVRSVFTAKPGSVLYAAGTTLVDHSTPIQDRWGGWFVTGDLKLKHRGNKIYREIPQGAEIDSELNISDIADRGYLAKTSDVIALMLLEHQVRAHTLIAHLSIQTQLALYQQREIDQLLNRTEPVSESTRSRIKSATDQLLRYLFFTDEAEIPRIQIKDSVFARKFDQRGPQDEKGRSLYQLKMEHRMFEYPLSYLIYSRAIAELPVEAQDYLWSEVKRILESGAGEEEYENLSQQDKHNIAQILKATHPQFK